MKQTRRDLFKYAAGAGAGLALPRTETGRAPRTQQEASAGIQAVARKRIPKTGELLPVIGLGSSNTFDVDPEQPNQPLVEVVRGFLAAGGSVIDSSPMYRRSEAVIGTLLKKVGRRDAFFTTKVYTDGREAGMQQMRESVQKMWADRMDLMQVHNLRDYQTQLKTLHEWKDNGTFRYIGITEMRNWPLVEELMKTEDLDFIQIPYSLGERAVEERILRLAADTGTGVLCMRPFMGGRMFQAVADREVPAWAKEYNINSWGQFALKFIISHPAVTCPIPATSKPHHLVDNMQGGVGPIPDAATRKKMVEYMEPLLAALPQRRRR